MFGFMTFAVLLVALADCAVITVEPFENKTDGTEGTVEELMAQVKDWSKMEMNETSSILQEEVKEAEIWLQGVKNFTEEWAEEKFNEIEDFVKNKVVGTEEIVQALSPKINEDGCLCYQKTCGCCVHAVEPEIHLNSTVCINVTYLSEDYGISFTLTLNNHTLYNETVSVRNPPPICIGFPYVKELADICVRLYDIDTTSRRFHACARLEARMKLVLIAHYDLGCFTIGSSVRDKTEGPEALFQPSVLLI